MMNKQFILSYLAGFFDGEGSFGFIKHKKHKYKNDTYSLEPYIYIGNTNKSIMNYISKIFGNKIKYKKFNDIKHKDQWHLYYHGMKDVQRICKQLSPYLRVKKKNAKILLNFIKLRLSPKGKKRLIKYTSKELIYYKQMQKLNKKGKWNKCHLVGQLQNKTKKLIDV